MGGVIAWLRQLSARGVNLYRQWIVVSLSKAGTRRGDKQMRAALLAFTLLASVVQLSAQQASTVRPTVSRILAAMNSQDSSERSKAFDEANELLASGKSTPGDIDRLRLGIIRLLIAENARINVPDDEVLKQAARAASCGNGTDNCEGDESDYYPSLIATVAGFNDERAIPALVGAMPWASDATGGLLRFGNKALGPVLDQLKSRNALLRTSAMSMTIDLLEGRNDSASRTRIREMLRSALTDPDAVVRGHAVKEIGCLDDRQDFVPILEKLAKTDPTHYRGRADDGVDGDQFYPVRVDARRVLREIQTNVTCSWRRATR